MNCFERAKEVEELIQIRNLCRNLEGKKEFLYTVQSISKEYYIFKIYLNLEHKRYYPRNYVAQITIARRDIFNLKYDTFKEIADFYNFTLKVTEDQLDKILENKKVEHEIITSLDQINIYLSELERLLEEIFV